VVKKAKVEPQELTLGEKIGKIRWSRQEMDRALMGKCPNCNQNHSFPRCNHLKDRLADEEKKGTFKNSSS
jgi:hypothetical protein